METLLALLLVLFLIALIIGLIKPNLIMFWSKNPKRIKVLGWWALASFLLIIISAIMDTDASKIDKAKNEISLGQYEEAIYDLKLIPEDSEFYLEADSLINYAQEQIQLEIELAEYEREEAEKAKREEKKKEKIEQLEREISSINDGVDFSVYRGSVESIQMELVLFNAWVGIIEEAVVYEDEELQKLANTLKQKVINIQVKEFPKLRKAYKEAIYQDLWVEDIETAVLGSRNTTIQFTGGVFANNKAKQQTQETLNEILHMLRFKRANYKWYEYDEEYTYYTIKSPKDNELVKIE